jgi:hypothetical protein
MTLTHEGAYRELLRLMNRLDEAHIYYHLRHSRPDAVSIDVDVPGERWEIEFVDYDEEVQIEVEVFRSVRGVVSADGLIDRLIATHGSAADAE